MPLAGALLLLGPALLKVRLGVDEVVTTLLLNFIVLLFVSMMLDGPMKDPMGMGWPQSPPVLPEAELPKLVAAHAPALGLVLALALAAVAGLALHHPHGLAASRSARSAPTRAARFAGMPVARVLHPHGHCCPAPWPGSPAPSRSPASTAT